MELEFKEKLLCYDNNSILIITDFCIPIVADKILKTIEILQRAETKRNSLPLYRIHDSIAEEFENDINNIFKLDMKNNTFHELLWENWIRFMANINLIDIGTSKILASTKDIEDLKYIIDNDIRTISEFNKTRKKV